jgi:hypothetical protein
VSKQRRVAFRVEFDLPYNATIKDARAYLDDAVGSMYGSYRPPGTYDETDPGDPFWAFDPDTLKITQIKEPKP